ncbi:MAG: hypothetical protein J5765_05190 [Clostridia bacterium]|nr:hypothetical protein [Clostridia bacterium]
MYFLTALVCTIVAGVLFVFFRDRKGLHLDFLTITFGAATLMWLVDCIAGAIAGEPFLSFDDPQDGWIALWTLLGGIGLWLVVAFVMNNGKKETPKE